MREVRTAQCGVQISRAIYGPTAGVFLGGVCHNLSQRCEEVSVERVEICCSVILYLKLYLKLISILGIFWKP